MKDIETDLRDYYASLGPASSVGAARRMSETLDRARTPRVSFRLPVRGLALAGAVAILAILVAAPLLLAPPPKPLASPSPTPTFGTLPPPSSPTIPTVQAGWKVLLTNLDASLSWSPDGRWLAVSSIPPQKVQLFDAAGKLVRTLDAAALTWLDDTLFVARSGSAYYLGSADTPSLESLPSLSVPAGAASTLLSNAHGALALAQVGDYARLDQATFKIWTPTGTSRSLAGVPAAWSADGSRLAVIRYNHGNKAQGMPSGWLEVLSWPGLETLARFDQGKDTYTNLGITFDPSGRYLAAPYDGGTAILDIPTGEVSGRITALTSTGSWYGEELLTTRSDGSVAGYSIDGAQVAGETYAGNEVSTSADGSAAVISGGYPADNPQPGTMILLRNGQTRTIEVPGAVLAFLSDNGSGVAVLCDTGDVREILLLRL